MLRKGVFSVWSVPRLYNEIIRITEAVKSQFSVADSHGKFVVEEQLEVGLWWLNVWLEDLFFIYIVVQWYLECDSFTSCVKIRCQEADSKNIVKA
jgi:hypothetical protein